ncbi:MAG TPA: chemotaxis protein CheA, partial [Cellvibrionaceae bacterium]
MAIDLSQFRQVFIEESFEGLDSMEAALMALDINAIDSEIINAIFRAAHSIKGGGATFGFSAIVGFTHVLETLLDQVRGGKRSLDAESVNLLLKSVDALREMLALLQLEQNSYTQSALDLKAQFEALLDISVVEEAATEFYLKPAASVTTEKTAKKKSPRSLASDNAEVFNSWIIEFAPHIGLFASGNCPVNILRELGRLGTLVVEPILNKIPPINNILPENCYLAWRISLTSSCTEEQIVEVFSWVDDHAKISIEKSAATICPAENVSSAGWNILFKPKPELLHTGNDPVRLFRALQELGHCEITPVIEQPMPSFHLYDSQLLYISWDIKILGDVSYAAIMEVFDWVSGDCELTITASNEESLDAEITARGINDVTQNEVINTVANNVVPFTVQSAVQVSAAVADVPKKAASTETSSIRVGIDKIDSLINMVGELVITQSMLGQLGSELDLAAAPKLMEGLSQLAQNTRELQESVMRIRMLPISFVFSRFPRMVRDLGQSLGKNIHIELNGENTELDKTVMEKIGDPLVHLVRNAVDHGIESPAERLAKGKSEQGHIMLNAYHQSGNVVIEITDDGKGLDRDAIVHKAIEKN